MDRKLRLVPILVIVSAVAILFMSSPSFAWSSNDLPLIKKRISINKNRYLKTMSGYRKLGKNQRLLPAKEYRRRINIYKRRIKVFRTRLTYYKRVYKQVKAQTVPLNPDKKSLGIFTESIDELNHIETLTGHQFKIFLTYQSIIENFNVELAEYLWNRGTYLQLAWEPRNPSGDSVNQPSYKLSTIIAGEHDSNIRRWARELKSFGRPVYFRPMCEMNGDWTSWSGTVNGNTPHEYSLAWRHIYNIFAEEEVAKQIYWVWAPNRDGSYSSAQSTFETYYPGNDYVDFIGLNGYNWGTMYETPTWISSWQNFKEIFGYSYTVYAGNTIKPMMVSETSSTEIGGNKGDWVQSTLINLLSEYPRIDMIFWFNINKETDWRINSSSASLEAFKTYSKYHD